VGARLIAAFALGPDAPFGRLAGVGGIGSGMVFALEGTHDLGRNESRPGRLLDVRDYCKLHIVAHYPAVLLGARPAGTPFHVLPIGTIGDDEPGRRLQGEMAAAGMDLRFVATVPGRPTLFSVCFLYPDGSGGNITTVDSAAAALALADVDRAAYSLDSRTIALAAPEVPLAVRHHLLKRAGPRGALRVAVLTSAEMDEARSHDFFADVDLLALNEDEAAALTGRSFDRADPQPLLEACARLLLSPQPKIRVVLTAGAEGGFAFADERWVSVPALKVTAVSTAGAGDALLGGVLTGLALGLPFAPSETNARAPRSLAERPLASAVELGALLAAYSVTSPHTIHPDTQLSTLRTFAAAHGVAFAEPLRRLFGNTS